jgi:Raf kinase inhibitor-like YbhB/YbcL family protein
MQRGEHVAALSITSPAFRPMGAMPARYTCDGENASPALEWTNVPAAARSLVLIVDDPDAPDPAAPTRTFVHWLLFEIAPTVDRLPDDATNQGLPEGARAGLNDWGRRGYSGPCPPVGRHRYFFRLFALDTRLADLVDPTRADVDRAMTGHVLQSAELVATYERTR